MKSSLLGSRPRLRRWLPWALWAGSVVIAIPMAMSQAGVASSPAVIEAKMASLAPIRTAHRLRVAKILVRPGQPVKAGDLLVQMDTTEVDADLAVARAKLAYVEIMADWRKLRLQDERARTSHALAARAERAALDTARIVAETERDRSGLAQLDANLAVEQQLVGDQLASAERLRAMRLERAALGKKVEQSATAVAQARKSASGASERLVGWQQNSRDQSAVPFLSVLDRGPAAAVELQRREIARLELVRSYHEIRAPFDGRVGEVLAQVGEPSADPASPMLTLVEEHSSIAIAYLGQSKASQVRVGDLAKLVPRDLSGPALHGRVISLAPSIGEVPERFRRVPRLPEYGRNVYIRLDVPASLPGQAFDAIFRRGPGGGT